MISLQGVTVTDIGGFVKEFGYPFFFGVSVLWILANVVKELKPLAIEWLKTMISTVQHVDRNNAEFADGVASLARSLESLVMDSREIKQTTGRIEAGLATLVNPNRPAPPQGR